MSETVVKREPFLRTLSDNVEVQYGWKDGHARVSVRLPIPFRPWFPQEVAANEIFRFKSNFDDALKFGLLPAEERAKWGKPVLFEARSDCRGRWGYADAHVELDVWKVVWITLNFPFEEFKLAKAAFDEAYAWAQMPQEIRDLQGV